MSIRIIRIQDAEGRGPFRPGFSAKWLDDVRNFSLPSVIEEFPKEVRRIQATPGYYGCGCRDIDQLRTWFTPAELVRLQILGYRMVALDADEVLAESKHQVLFRRSRPLSEGIEAVS